MANEEAKAEILTPVWRVGSKVPVNVYEGDRPVCQCRSEEYARRIVAAMNAPECPKPDALERLPDTVFVYGAYGEICSSERPNPPIEYDEVDIRAALEDPCDRKEERDAPGV